MENNEDLELEEQLATLGVDLGGGTKVKAPEPVQQVVQQPQQSIPQPYTPENPTNVGVVTNNVTPQPVQQVIQEQVNQQAQAQTVATTTTVGNSMQVPNHTVVPPVRVTQQPVQNTQQNDEVVFIDLAKAVRTQQTPWLRLKDNEWSRVLFLDLRKVIPIKVHYLKGLGFVKCLSTIADNGYSLLDADCCSKIEPTTGQRVPRLDDRGNQIKPKNRYLVPVIEYPVDKSNANKLIPGQSPQLKMWNMNAVEWGDLVEGIQAIADDPEKLETADLTNVDFLLHKDASGQFKTTSVKASPKCFRNDFAAVIQGEEAKATQEFYTIALKEARKIVSLETINTAYANQEAENTMVNNMMNEGYGNQNLDI